MAELGQGLYNEKSDSLGAKAEKNRQRERNGVLPSAPPFMFYTVKGPFIGSVTDVACLASRDTRSTLHFAFIGFYETKILLSTLAKPLV